MLFKESETVELRKSLLMTSKKKSSLLRIVMAGKYISVLMMKVKQSD